MSLMDIYNWISQFEWYQYGFIIAGFLFILAIIMANTGASEDLVGSTAFCAIMILIISIFILAATTDYKNQQERNQELSTRANEFYKYALEKPVIIREVTKNNDNEYSIKFFDYKNNEFDTSYFLGRFKHPPKPNEEWKIELDDDLNVQFVEKTGDWNKQ